MHPPPRFAVLLCLGMVAGCAVGPDYSEPRVELPEHFSAQTSKARQLGASGANGAGSDPDLQPGAPAPVLKIQNARCGASGVGVKQV